jgi:hypothetical protein
VSSLLFFLFFLLTQDVVTSGENGSIPWKEGNLGKPFFAYIFTPFEGKQRGFKKTVLYEGGGRGQMTRYFKPSGFAAF